MGELKLLYQIKFMELTEIILEIIKNKKIKGDITDQIITTSDLIPYHYYLTKCDIFKDCELEYYDATDKLLVDEFKTIKLAKETKFINKMTIFNIVIGPSMYVGEKLHTRPSNNALISPTLYDAKTFAPYRMIQFWLTPEHGYDITDIEVKENLMKRFNDVLINPHEYEVPKTHSILLRGKFEICPLSSLIDKTELNIEAR